MSAKYYLGTPLLIVIYITTTLQDGPWNFASTIGNSWRMSGDIYDSFNRPDPACPCETYDCLLPGFRCSVMNIINKAVAVGQKARSGGWNDLDMLEVGNGGMSHEEYRLHYTMWAALKSPLLLGNDVTNMTSETKEIIMNKEVIAVNQDSEYSPAVRMWVKGDQQMFSGNLANNTQVVILLNAGDKAAKMTATWDDIWFYSQPNVDASKSIEVRDLWKMQSLGNFTNSISLDVPAHGVRMVKFMGSAQSS